MNPGAVGRMGLPAMTHKDSVNRPWRRGLLWLALLAPFFYASYGLANHLAAARAQVPAIVFGWERHIPFWDWTIFPYWSINVFYGLSLLLARTRHELDRHAARLLTAQVAAVLCFIAWPLQFSFGQPVADGAAGWLFAALRGFDKPFNQAPSLHIALALILWDLYRRLLTGRAARVVLHAWTFLICASVLTTYQHHFIDIPAGALLGALCVWAWPLERRVSMRQACALTTDRRRRALAARYAAGALALIAVSLTLGGIALWMLWGAVSLALVAANYLLFGARGFCMAANGRMAWETRLLLAPYRAGAALNARLWTRGQPPLRDVVAGVSLGGLTRLPSAAIGTRSTLVSLSAELDVPAQARCHCLPWLDLVPASPAALRRAAAIIDRAVAAGQPVVVGCALGLSRSTAALACWLARSGHAHDADAAVRWLRRVQPDLALGEDWQRVLREAVGR